MYKKYYFTLLVILTKFDLAGAKFRLGDGCLPCLSRNHGNDNGHDNIGSLCVGYDYLKIIDIYINSYSILYFVIIIQVYLIITRLKMT